MFTRAFYTPNRTGVMRTAYGLREVVAGVGILTTADPAPWLWARVAGDALDLGTLLSAHDEDKPEHVRRNVDLALASVVAVTALDVYTALAFTGPSGRPFGHARSDGHDRPGEARTSERVVPS